jgi:C4-dicarboxylate transporter DctM subunit
MIGLLLILVLGLLALGFPIYFALGFPGVVGFLYMNASSVTMFLNAAYNGLDSFPLMAVPFFILAGKLMEMGGISERLVNLISFFVGRIVGSLAIIGVGTCALFGAVSGSAIATSVSVGGIVMPSMDKEGYDRYFSAALMGVAGTIGALIPPSMTFIIYGAMTGVSIGDMFIAGIIPGLMVTLVLMVISYFICKKHGWGLNTERVIDRSIGGLWKVFKDAFWALLVPVIILGGIYGGVFTPTEAGVVASVYAIIAACFIYKTLNLKGLYKTIAESVRLCVVTMFIVAFASGFARYLTMEKAPQSLSDWLVSVSSSPVMFITLVALLLLLVGCFMDTTAACIVLAPLLHPIAVRFGVDGIQFGMIMSMALLIGLCTPPVGANLYVMASVTRLPFMGIAKRMVPFIVGFLIVLALIMYVPGISTVLLGR